MGQSKCLQKTITFKGINGELIFRELEKRRRDHHLNVSSFVVEALAEKLLCPPWKTEKKSTQTKNRKEKTDEQDPSCRKGSQSK